MYHFPSLWVNVDDRAPQPTIITSAYETCLHRRTLVSSPLHRRRCGGQSLLSALSPPDPSLRFPPSSRNIWDLFFFFAHPLGHVPLRGSRCPAVRRRSGHGTRQVLLWAALLLRGRLASLQQTGLEMVPCSSLRLRSEVGAPHGGGRGWRQGLSIQRMLSAFLPHMIR